MVPCARDLYILQPRTLCFHLSDGFLRERATLRTADKERWACNVGQARAYVARVAAKGCAVGLEDESSICQLADTVPSDVLKQRRSDPGLFWKEPETVEELVFVAIYGRWYAA
jgi:hypothetical protein